MLQIPHHSLFKTGCSYAALAQQYLTGANMQLTVLRETQQTVLSQLDSQIKNEHFYLLTNVKTGEIMHCNGVSRWLGYTDTHFNQRTYHNIIYPAHATVQSFYAVVLFQLFVNQQISLKFYQPTFSSTLALKNKSGKYMYCKRQCRPYQLTSGERMTAYISEFMVIKDYVNEEFYTGFYYGNGEDEDMKEVLQKALKKKFEENGGFSVQEFRILKRYAYTENVSSETIAKAFRIEKATVETYNKRILKKTETIFKQRFDNAKNAAEYFKRMQLI